MTEHYDFALNYPFVPGQDEDVDTALAAGAHSGERDHAIRATLMGDLATQPEIGMRLTSGGQAALAGAILAACPPGSFVAAEAQTFPQFRRWADRLGLRLIGVDMDEDGILPGSLEDACRAGAGMLYTMPTFHNPEGTVMPLERRMEIAAIADRHRLTIIEGMMLIQAITLDVSGALVQWRHVPDGKGRQVLPRTGDGNFARLLPCSVPPRAMTWTSTHGIKISERALAEQARSEIHRPGLAKIALQPLNRTSPIGNRSC